MRKALRDVLDLLDLEPIEVNMFRGISPDEGWQRVYGGQAVRHWSQLLALSRTRVESHTRCTATSFVLAIQRSPSSTLSTVSVTVTVSPHDGLLPYNEAKLSSACQFLSRSSKKAFIIRCLCRTQRPRRTVPARKTCERPISTISLKNIERIF